VAPVSAQTISSDADQTCTVGDPATRINTITITDDALTPTITGGKGGKENRIRIPSSFNMTRDTSMAMLTIGGPAVFFCQSTLAGTADRKYSMAKVNQR
jgi:hypothetical protein